MKWLESEQPDPLFVTLVKSEARYSPTTMYADRAITEHPYPVGVETTTSATSATGQRYAPAGSSVHLFVQETRIADRDLGPRPYLYAGTMTYDSHMGDRPIRVLWHLRHALPANVYATARTIAA
ncbi:DUF3427 domain-containing protein [Micromonospora arida]